MYSFGCMIGSFIWGRLYDYAESSLTPLLMCHSILTGVNFAIIMALIFSNTISALLPGFLTVGFIFGLNDYLINAIINNSISDNFD